MSFDPGIYSQIQNNVFDTMNSVLTNTIGYSQDLLYLCASIEVVLFALMWAIQGNNAFGRLIFTILKIGFLLMVIDEFSSWLGLLLSSFGQISEKAANSAEAFQLLTAPGEIWQYGYDNALVLLKTASMDGISMGLSLLLTTLGLGILLIFGLLGARLIVQIAAFYTTALVALIFLPFGILKPTADFAYRGLQSVIKSGVGLLSLILILTIATGLWHSQGGPLPANFNLNQVLGLFFSGLVFLLLAQLLPKIAASAIGHITPLVSESSHSTSTTSSTTPIGSSSDALRAATTINVSADNAKGGHFAAAVQISNNSTSGGSLSPSQIGSQDKQQRGRFNQAIEVAPSISASTLQKLANTKVASAD
jgi:P-type conjugative transfer protein TrbL